MDVLRWLIDSVGSQLKKVSAAVLRGVGRLWRFVSAPLARWIGLVVWFILLIGLLVWAGSVAGTDAAFAACLLLGTGALLTVLSWFVVWAGDGQKNEAGRVVLRWVGAFWRFLGFAGLLYLVVYMLKPILERVINTALQAAAIPGELARTVSASAATEETVERSLAWPQAMVLVALVLSVSAVMIALIYAVARYFRD